MESNINVNQISWKVFQCIQTHSTFWVQRPKETIFHTFKDCGFWIYDSPRIQISLRGCNNQQQVNCLNLDLRNEKTHENSIGFFQYFLKIVYPNKRKYMIWNLEILSKCRNVISYFEILWEITWFFYLGIVLTIF